MGDGVREFDCRRCSRSVRVCRPCDRGQVYCAAGCARSSRHGCLRAARRRYQQSRRGAHLHAARQRRYRARCALRRRTNAKIVTDHTSAAARTVGTVVVGEMTAVRERDDDPNCASGASLRCDFCGRVPDPDAEVGSGGAGAAPTDATVRATAQASAARGRSLLVSAAEIGQQLPVVVIEEAPSFILIDGYKRVRALKRLARDTVRATCWQVAEAEALLLERGLRRGSEDALDQAWLLAELQERCQWSLEELARRFEHSKSWVSGRLALLQALPVSIQEQIRAGTLSAHAAMKYLVPLARVNAAAAQALATALTPLKPTSRQVGALYAGWQAGTERTRELIVRSPQVYLQAQATRETAPPSATQRFLQDLGALGGIARRAHRILEGRLLAQLRESELTEVTAAFARANGEVQRLVQRFEVEIRPC